METKTIYAVMSSKGFYDDYHEWVEKCFTNMDAAAEYARIVDISHEFPMVIAQDVWDDLETHFYRDYYDPAVEKFCKENNIPTEHELSTVTRTEKQREQVYRFCDNLEKKYDDWCKKYLIEHYPEYTEHDYDKQLECEEHKYDDWHPCTIEELDLVIS